MGEGARPDMGNSVDTGVAAKQLRVAVACHYTPAPQKKPHSITLSRRKVHSRRALAA